jgi:hypothetical protein
MTPAYDFLIRLMPEVRASNKELIDVAAIDTGRASSMSAAGTALLLMIADRLPDASLRGVSTRPQVLPRAAKDRVVRSLRRAAARLRNSIAVRR